MPKLFSQPYILPLLLTGLPLHTVSAFANDTQETDTQSAINAPVSTVDNPAPYLPLDWLSPAAIQALPANQRPPTGVCESIYLPPKINPGSADTPPSQAPIEATADHYQSDPDGTITLTGDVIIQQGSRQLESDTIRIQQKTRETELVGNVRIRQEGMLMVGEKANLDLTSKNISVEHAEYVVHENRIRGKAARIHNEDENILVLDDSSYTTCEPNSNAWLFEADDIRLNKRSGWGTAKHAVVRVKDVPVFYFPWMMFPIDDRRQSGFLFPSFGSGEENGTSLAVPYYLNLAPNYDATLTPRHMSDRGTQLEAEFRYLTRFGEGEIGAAYLPEDKSRDDEARQLSLWQHRGYFADHWYTRVDYNHVSDDDYFDDLATSLSAKSTTHLDQEVELGYNTVNWDGALKLEQFQTLSRSIADEDLPYRKMPQLTLEGRWPLSNNQFYGLWHTDATRFEHPNDDFIGVADADRVTVAPGIEYHYRKPSTHITPKLELIHSYFDFDSNTADATLNESQTLYRASLDAKLFLDRQLIISDNHYTQTLEPRFYYLYTPFEEQNHRQVFDSGLYTFDFSQLFRDNRFAGGDRFSDANQVAIGLTTRFIENATGWERFQAGIGQIFYFADRKVQLDADTPKETRGRSPWAVQLAWRINTYWRLQSDILWDEDNDNVDRGSLGMNYRSGDKGLLNLSYRYLDEGAPGFEVAEIEQSDVSFVWPVNNHWSLVGRWGYDMTYRRSFENLFGVEYDSCCWRVRLVNRRYLNQNRNDPEDVETQRGIFLQFQLKGLGGVGKELDDLLDESIYDFSNRHNLNSYSN